MNLPTRDIKEEYHNVKNKTQSVPRSVLPEIKFICFTVS
jgi:hypothetical protein